MEDIGATSFTVAEAIVELVANSMDAKVDGSEIAIDIFIDPEEIRVIDDGHGMTHDRLAQAVRLGVKMEQEESNSRKGMFGLGMKTACASLGKRWSVTTRPVDQEREFFVEFDLEEWSGQAGDPDFEWSIEIEEREPDGDGVLGRREHGTAIVVNELRDFNPLPGPVLDKLGRAYMGHLERGDKISVNGEEARPPEYDLIEGSKIEIDESCGEDDEHRIYGWIGLDKKTHNDGSYGLNLYRKGQLIESWNKDWFNPHPMTSRIMGEIHLDFVPPNFYKRGFERQSEEWNMASEVMDEVLDPVEKASRKASRGKDPQKGRKAARGLQEAMGSSENVSEMPGSDESENDSDSDIDGSEEYDDEEEISVDDRTIVLDGETIHLSWEMAEIPDEQLPWDFIYDGSTHELQAILNTGSKLLEESSDHEIIGVLALADCVASFLTDEKGYDSSDARQVRNRWLNRTIEG